MHPPASNNTSLYRLADMRPTLVSCVVSVQSDRFFPDFKGQSTHSRVGQWEKHMSVPHHTSKVSLLYNIPCCSHKVTLITHEICFSFSISLNLRWKKSFSSSQLQNFCSKLQLKVLDTFTLITHISERALFKIERTLLSPELISTA